MQRTSKGVRFSSRLQWNATANQLAVLLESKRRAGKAVLDLTASNPTHAGFAYQAEILDALADPGALSYDPAPLGSGPAREAVAEYYTGRGMAVSAEQIVLTASTSEAYSYLFKLLADPGDEILVPRPSYPLFEFLAALESVRTSSYALEYHGAWELPVEPIRAALSPRTRAIVLVNPNNPTGSFLKREERDALAPLCRERGLALICDEVFSGYNFEPGAARAEHRVWSLAQEQDVLTFCLNGLSKLAGMPQIKAGWIVLAGPPELQAASRERLELIADTYLSVSTPVQIALPRLLSIGRQVRRQIQARVRKNLAHLQSAAAAQGSCRVLKAEGGWNAVMQVPRTRTEEQWCLELLERADVLVQPGFFYDFESEAYLVVSLLPPISVFREGVARLFRLLASHG